MQVDGPEQLDELQEERLDADYCSRIMRALDRSLLDAPMRLEG